ncbi:MAG: hypothetical protein AB4042_19990 [Leptolyngbyaceae cyanobacterium]
MTPTLLGRWQTRLLLSLTVGVLLTVPFAIVLGSTAFAVLAYVILFGLGWDALYTVLQKKRWDHDWPAVFQLAAGIWEALFFLALILTLGLPGINQFAFPVVGFILHYSTVWLGIFLASQVLMRLLFPRWRFQGGRWL